MKKAFSLIELMVVVAIIGILLSFLVPMMRGASGGSRRVKCMSFQKELVIGAVAYQTDHGTHVPAVSFIQNGTTTVMQTWDDEKELWQYLNVPADQMVCPNHIITTGSTTGFNYNTSFIGEEDYMFADAVKGVSPSECKHPASCAMFGDCSKNKFMRSPEIDAIYDPYTDSSTRCAGMQAFRHLDSTNVAWLDGHIDSTTHHFNDCTDESNIGFLGEDNTLYDPRVISIIEN